MMMSGRRQEDFIQLDTQPVSKEKLDRLHEACLPNRMSQVGFIKADQDVVLIIKTDRDYLQSVAVTPQQIVARLGELLDHFSFPKTEVKHGNYHIKLTNFLGYQLCPFEVLYDEPNQYKRHNYWANSEMTLSNLKKNLTVTFPSMLLHLIEHYCFFEGGNFRVEPQTLLSVLELI